MKFTIGKKLGLGFTVTCACLIGIALVNAYLANQFKAQANLARQESAVFALKAKGLQFDTVQVQQWLTDISATRGKGGLDDGFDEAKASADKFRKGLNDFRNMYTNEGDKDGLAKLDALETSFGEYYEMGKKMAAAYVEGGPDSGNPLMEQFDPFAARITKEIDVFVQEQTDELDSAMQSIVTGADTTINVGMIVGGDWPTCFDRHRVATLPVDCDQCPGGRRRAQSRGRRRLHPES